MSYFFSNSSELLVFFLSFCSYLGLIGRYLHRGFLCPTQTDEVSSPYGPNRMSHFVSVIDGEAWHFVDVNLDDFMSMGDPSFKLHFRMSRTVFEVRFCLA